MSYQSIDFVPYLVYNLSYLMDSSSEQFSGIYDAYIEKIYRFVYLKVNSQETAEDISSKVFLKGWEKFRDGGGNIEHIGSFLYQIARNMVIDHYRDRSRTKTVSPDAVPQIADAKTDVHEGAALNADLQMVKNAIQNIKKEYQDVLILHYLEDMPTEQIAQVMQKSPGSVRVMLHRGLKSLKNEVIKES